MHIRVIGFSSLVVGSAVAAILFIAGVDGGVFVSVKWALYLPFYGVLFMDSLVQQATGFSVLTPVLFLAGVVLSGVYLTILLKKIPFYVGCIGVGVIFFVFLLISGRNVFVRIMYVPLSPVDTAVYAVKVFCEFLVGLVVLYVVVGEGSLRDKVRAAKGKEKKEKRGTYLRALKKRT